VGVRGFFGVQMFPRFKKENRMKKAQFIFLSAMLATAQFCFAADLYDAAGKLRQIAMNDPIVATDTVGGFAIYQGDGDWKFEQGKSSTSSGGSQTISVPMASFIINKSINGELFQRLSLVSTLGSTGGSGWSGSPCSVDHLIIKDKMRGREDHCMTIDPLNVTVGTKGITFLAVRVTHSASGRYYAQNLMVNPNLLGSRDTGLADWTEGALAIAPHRKALHERLTAWAEKYLDASLKAFDYSQPQDAYSNLLSVQTLVPTVAEFPADKYSLGFRSVLEDIKYRPGPKAMAYFVKTDTKTPNQYWYNQNSQEEADKKALEGCNQRRVAGDAECKLIPAAMLQPPVPL
jgi:hypothetical protein